MAKFKIDGKERDISEDKIDAVINDYDNTSAIFFNSSNGDIVEYKGADVKHALSIKEMVNIYEDEIPKVAKDYNESMAYKQMLDKGAKRQLQDKVDRFKGTDLNNIHNIEVPLSPVTENDIPKAKDVVSNFGSAYTQGLDQGWQGAKYGLMDMIGGVGATFTGVPDADDATVALNLLNSGKWSRRQSSEMDKLHKRMVLDSPTANMITSIASKAIGMESPESRGLMRAAVNMAIKTRLSPAAIAECALGATRYIGDLLDTDPDELIARYKEEGKSDQEVIATLENRIANKNWIDEVKDDARKAISQRKESVGLPAYLGEMASQATVMLPAIAAAAIPGGQGVAGYLGAAQMGYMTAGSYGDALKQANDYRVQMSEVGVEIPETDAVSSAVLAGAAEYVGEKIMIGRYLPDIKLSKIANKVMGRSVIAQAVNNPLIKSEFNDVMKHVLAKRGVKVLKDGGVDYLKDVLSEGVSEAATSIMQDAAKLVYQREEDYPNVSDVITNAAISARDGAFLGSILGGASKASSMSQSHFRRKKQGQMIMASDNKGNVYEILSTDDKGNATVATQGGSATKVVRKEDLNEQIVVDYPSYQKYAKVWARDKKAKMVAREQMRSYGYNTEMNAYTERIEAYKAKDDQGKHTNTIIQAKDKQGNAIYLLSTSPSENGAIMSINEAGVVAMVNYKDLVDISEHNADEIMGKAKKHLTQKYDIIKNNDNIDSMAGQAASVVAGDTLVDSKIKGADGQGNVVVDVVDSKGKVVGQEVVPPDAVSMEVPLALPSVGMDVTHRDREAKITQMASDYFVIEYTDGAKPAAAQVTAHELQRIVPITEAIEIENEALNKLMEDVEKDSGGDLKQEPKIGDTNAEQTNTVEQQLEPSIDTQAKNDNQKQKETHSYPIDKRGKPDFAKFSPEQLFDYTSQSDGIEIAIGDAQQEIERLAEEVSKLEKRLEKANIADKPNLRDQRKILEQDILQWQGLIDTNSPQPSLVEQSESSNIPPQSQEEYIDWVCEESNDPIEIAQVYKQEMELAGYNALLPWQAQLLGSKVTRESFIQWGDKANITKSIAVSWFRARPEGVPIDGLSMELKEFGADVTEQMIVEFIMEHPQNREIKSSPTTKKLNWRFSTVVKELTGKNVGGVDSGLGKLVVAGIQAGRRSEQQQQLLPFKEADVPEALVKFLEVTEVEIDNFNSFGEFLDYVESEKNNTFDFPLSETHYSNILNYINNVRKQKEWSDFARYVKEKSHSGEAEQIIPTQPESEPNENDPSEEEWREYVASKNALDDLIDSPTKESPEITLQTAEQAVDPSPSQAQKEAGNYKKGHVGLWGHNITIENPKGSERSGTDHDGNPWSITMNNTYGYIKGTMGKDGDHVDVFIGDNLDSDKVFVVDQINNDGEFDEHKVMLGFDSAEQAKENYLANYEKDWRGLGEITEVSLEAFNKWVNSGTKKSKPFSQYKVNKKDQSNQTPEIDEAKHVPQNEKIEDTETNETRFRDGNESLEKINLKFNKDLVSITPENADSKVLYLGVPSPILRSVGINNKTLKLYGNKLLKKAKKHQFDVSSIKDMPIFIQNPIAIFKGAEDGSFAILAELQINNKNVLVSLELGVDRDIDFNIISSVYGKNNKGVIFWINNDKLRYCDKEKALNYLSTSAPIADATNNSELLSATKIIESFDNPILKEKNIDSDLRLRDGSNSLEQINNQFNQDLQQQIDGNLPKGHIYQLGKPSEILLSAGIPNLPIELSATRLLSKSQQDEHPFDLSEIKDLAGAIHQPLMIFDSATKKGSFVVVTEIEHNGRNFVVAIEANRTKGNIEINDVRSVHYRTNNVHFVNWISDGNLRFVDKEKTFEWFSKQQYNSAEVKGQFKRATNIVRNFENPKLSAQINNNNTSLGNNPSPLDAAKRVVADKRALDQSIRDKASEISEKLGVKINVVESSAEIKDDNPNRLRRKRRAKGWFTPSTGEVTIVLSNATSLEDALSTILHEAVGHKGLRELLGEHFDTFLDNVYNNVEQTIREKIDARGEDKRIATEEYMAELAEKGAATAQELSAWSKVKELFVELLSKVGINLKNKLSDADLRYIIWKSYNKLKENASAIETAQYVAKEYELKERFNDPIANEQHTIITEAMANGSYLKAPNGKESNLSPKQWVQVRTKAFNEWFGDWQKASRIEKLRQSKPIEITGEEIPASDDLKQYKKNALEYGKGLQGFYTNKDTSAVVHLQRGRKNGGVNEVLQHDYKDVEHLQSVAAIPEIIENSVYMDSRSNFDSGKNPNVSEYQYYVCGLSIGNVDYTVRSVIAVDKNGDKYYDHKLTLIEKTKLLNQINDQAVISNGFGTTPSTRPTTNYLYKDKVLVSILQTNSSKVVDENGEPLVVYHGTGDQFWTFKHSELRRREGSFFFAQNKEDAQGYSGTGRVMEVFINLQNPADFENLPNDLYKLDTKKDIVVKLKELGYDGWMSEMETQWGEVSAFSANQIKSATDNVGAFNPTNDDIRYREEDSSATPNPSPIEKAYWEMCERFDRIQIGHNRWGIEASGGAPDVETIDRVFDQICQKGMMVAAGVRNSGFASSLIDVLPKERLTTILGSAHVSEYGKRMREYVMDVLNAQYSAAEHEMVVEHFRKLSGYSRATGQNFISAWMALEDKDDPLTVAKKVAGASKYQAETSARETTLTIKADFDKEIARMLRFKSMSAENIFDDVISVKKLQEMIEEASGEKIVDAANLYQFWTTMGSRRDFLVKEFAYDKYQPLMATLRDLNSKGVNMEDASNYLFAKHIPERNEYMRNRERQAIIDKEMKEIDQELIQKNSTVDPTTGISKLNDGYDLLKDPKREKALQKIEKNTPMPKTEYAAQKVFEEDVVEMSCQQYASILEKNYKRELDDLLKALKDVNNATIDLSVECGTLSPERAEHIKSMYEYYTPMRGFKQDTASDIYEYSYQSSGVSNPIKKANGRYTMPDNPIDAAIHMFEQEVLIGVKNQAKLKLYHLASMYDNDYLSASDSWVTNEGTNENPRWVTAFAEYSDDAQEMDRNIKEFEQIMLERQKQGTAQYHKNALNAGVMIVEKKQKQEHIVRLKLNGVDKMVYANGSPRVAQTINGALRKESSKAIQVTAAITNFMSANMTARNPEFIISNFVRDLGNQILTAATVHGQKYAIEAQINCLHGGKAMAEVMTQGKRRWSKQYKPKDKYQEYFIEFLKYGGATSYADMLSGDKDKKRLLRDATAKAATLKAGVDLTNDLLQNASNFGEYLFRFVFYITSREGGKSIEASIYDAKEATVNFDRRGTGLKTLKALYSFSGSALNSIYRMWNIAHDHPKQFAGYFLTAPILTGILSAVTMAIGDDGDEPEEISDFTKINRWYLFDYKRENGDTNAVTLPVSYDHLIGFSIGSAFVQSITGYMKPGDATIMMLTNVLRMSPVAPEGFLQEGTLGQRLMSAAVDVAPSIVKPLGELNINRDFLGNRIYDDSYFKKNDPAYSKATKGTPEGYIAFSKMINDISKSPIESKGPIDAQLSHAINPSILEHLADSYLAGIWKFTTKSISYINALSNGTSGDLPIYKIPMVGRFVNKKSDSSLKTINAAYYELSELASGKRDDVRFLKKQGEYDNAIEAKTQSWVLQQIFSQSNKRIAELRSLSEKCPEMELECRELMDMVRTTAVSQYVDMQDIEDIKLQKAIERVEAKERKKQTKEALTY